MIDICRRLPVVRFGYTKLMVWMVSFSAHSKHPDPNVVVFLRSFVSKNYFVRNILEQWKWQWNFSLISLLFFKYSTILINQEIKGIRVLSLSWRILYVMPLLFMPSNRTFELKIYIKSNLFYLSQTFFSHFYLFIFFISYKM